MGSRAHCLCAGLSFGDTSYTNPDYQLVSKILGRTNARTNGRTNGRTNPFRQCFTPKGGNVQAARENLTASRENVTASRQCSTVNRYSLVLPLVRL